MNYTILQGKRKHSKIYCHEGYTYSKVTESDILKVRCRDYAKSKCKGKGYISHANEFVVTFEHNHDRDDLSMEKLKFVDELKTSVKSSTECTKNIYNAVAIRYTEECQLSIPYKSVRVTLQRLRKKNNTTLEQEGGRHSTCGVCLGDATEPWAFTPCGHHPFCETCSEKILKDTSPCAICRRSIVGRMRVFNINN